MGTGLAMELQKIRELIDVFKTSDLAEFEFAQGDTRVRFVKRAVPGSTQGKPSSNIDFITGQSLLLETNSTQWTEAASVDRDGGATTRTSGVVKSPLYGIVHLTPTPDAPPFVMPGDVIQEGQVICILEAMKIFHEIKADRSARLEKILVLSGEEVDAGAPLFYLSDTN